MVVIHGTLRNADVYSRGTKEAKRLAGPAKRHTPATVSGVGLDNARMSQSAAGLAMPLP